MGLGALSRREAAGGRGAALGRGAAPCRSAGSAAAWGGACGRGRASAQAAEAGAAGAAAAVGSRGRGSSADRPVPPLSFSMAPLPLRGPRPQPVERRAGPSTLGREPAAGGGPFALHRVAQESRRSAARTAVGRGGHPVAAQGCSEAGRRPTRLRGRPRRGAGCHLLSDAGEGSVVSAHTTEAAREEQGRWAIHVWHRSRRVRARRVAGGADAARRCSGRRRGKGRRRPQGGAGRQPRQRRAAWGGRVPTAGSKQAQRGRRARRRGRPPQKRRAQVLRRDKRGAPGWKDSLSRGCGAVGSVRTQGSG